MASSNRCRAGPPEGSGDPWSAISGEPTEWHPTTRKGPGARRGPLEPIPVPANADTTIAYATHGGVVRDGPTGPGHRYGDSGGSGAPLGVHPSYCDSAAPRGGGAQRTAGKCTGA
ncbi:hypothetical protein GCM10022220_58340 [Actinocatenispora rupis]|uniref:Uncharacterized protein n=1 Tax=Actinocatenispora rupis TaxID=519421 RepID=A0A8J3J6L0_9ACTN|nr:hypothetical protein Aru02nite_20310 [Actinocatenispora rupis]